MVVARRAELVDDTDPSLAAQARCAKKIAAPVEDKLPIGWRLSIAATEFVQRPMAPAACFVFQLEDGSIAAPAAANSRAVKVALRIEDEASKRPAFSALRLHEPIEYGLLPGAIALAAQLVDDFAAAKATASAPAAAGARASVEISCGVGDDPAFGIAAVLVTLETVQDLFRPTTAARMSS